MTDYNPDRWVLIKIKGDDPHYRVLAGWSGGYLESDSWRMNSGVTSHDFDGDYWYFYGSSGSRYKCYVDSYGFTGVSSGIYSQLKSKYPDKVELVKDQEWISKNWDWMIE